MEYFNEHKYGIIGAGIWIIMIMLLLLFLNCFTTPLPLPQEQGILLEFEGGGNINAGAASGGDQYFEPTNPVDNGFNTQDIEDAPSMQTSTNPHQTENHTTTQTTTTPEPPTNKANEKGINFGNAFSGGSGSGSGGTGSGGGNPGLGTSGSGGGSGNAPGGSGGSITGRARTTYVEPEKKKNTFGTVVLEIIVNSQGTVTNVALVKSDCAECTQLAINAVKQWKYAPLEKNQDQKGVVTVKFDAE